jgi:valyl-tRNA synthetase
VSAADTGSPPPGLPPRYEPKGVENRLYGEWMAAGAFRPDPAAPKGPFCIVIPPPNITGSLHMGHALDNSLQDILIRFKRMQGFSALWVPGTDHASIATHVVVERELKKEGLTRHDLGREKFLARVWEWRKQYGDRIVEQLKQMGCSCDWERERFTMDEMLSRAVREHFVRLYKEKIIFRGERIVNWCPRCLTALSDLEVLHHETDGHLWHIRYPLKGGGEAVVATTRPETMLGDVAVAVNPADERHKGIVGKTALLPLVGREIPVIADEYVDMAFGTGTLKITPAHDANDFAVGTRHKLEPINIFEPDAKLNSNGGPYAGLDRYKARERVLEDLEKQGLLVKTDPRRSPLMHCQRCNTVLEPIVSKQWWLKAGELAGPAIEAVRLGETNPSDPKAIRLVPDSAYAIFNEWMRNIRDWCISRQLWWGHRIPAWYCKACGETVVETKDPEKCPKCGGTLEQDPDVLDTWFSSALWPFSVFGWPEDTKDLRTYYPTSVLLPGWDIIFFWVARMMMAGLKLTGKKPFGTVIFHSLVTDPSGKKMSKSKGNVVDPMDLFDKYGTDAIRFTLTGQETLKQSFRMSEDKAEHGRNFMNKVWNAARFALGELEGFDPAKGQPPTLSVADRWMLVRIQQMTGELTLALENYQFSLYTEKIESFFWHEFCDVYLELAKPALKNPNRRNAAQWTLWTSLETLMRLMHPVIPYITEEIWRQLPRRPGTGKLLMLEPWPQAPADIQTGFDYTIMLSILGASSTIRALKHEQGIPLEEHPVVFLQPLNTSMKHDLGRILETGYIDTLGGAKVAPMTGQAPPSEPRVSAVIEDYTVYLLLPKPSDPEAEKKRLSKEHDELEVLLRKSRATLANADFTAKAPPALVEETKRKAADFEARIARLAERLKQL